MQTPGIFNNSIHTVVNIHIPNTLFTSPLNFIQLILFEYTKQTDLLQTWALYETKGRTLGVLPGDEHGAYCQQKLNIGHIVVISKTWSAVLPNNNYQWCLRWL